MNVGRWLAVLGMVGSACDPIAGACPTGVLLTEVDVPCTCQGSTIEKVDCGALVCTEAGLTIPTTTTVTCTGDTG